MSLPKRASLVLQIANVIIFIVFISYLSTINNITLLNVSKIGFISIIISLLLYFFCIPLIFNPFLIFIVSTMIFSFGHNILYIFDIKNIQYIFEYSYTNNRINVMSAIFTIISILFLILGGTCSIKKFSRVKVNSLNLRNVGKILFVISVFPTFFVAIIEAITSIKYGYTSLYTQTSNFIYLKPITIFFVPSLIILLIYERGRKSKIYSNILIIISLTYSGLLLIGGGRTSALALLVSLLVLRKFELEGSTSVKVKIKSFFVILVVLLLVPTFSTYRTYENKSFDALISSVSSNLKSNIIVDTVAELGHSGLPLMMTMKVIPEVIDFKNGESYLNSILSIYPKSLDPFGVIRESNKKVMLDQWLQDYFSMSYGPGYSLVAESYYNFGNYGVFVMFIWGVVLGRLLAVKTFSYDEFSNFGVYSKVILTYSLFTLPRRQTMYFLNQVVYLIVLVWIMLYILNQISKKKSGVD